MTRRARKRGAKGSFTLEEWQAKLKEYHYRCAYCGKTQAQHIRETGQKLHKDHIIPLKMGGTNYIDNIVPACRSCNSRKHTSVWMHQQKNSTLIKK